MKTLYLEPINIAFQQQRFPFLPSLAVFYSLLHSSLYGLQRQTYDGIVQLSAENSHGVGTYA